MYSALTIANFFVRKGLLEKITVSPMKLQKLIYFAHGWHLAFFDKPLIKEDIQAWAYGPVIPAIYHIYKNYGNTTIKEEMDEGEETLKTETIESGPLIKNLRRFIYPISHTSKTPRGMSFVEGIRVICGKGFR